MEFSRVLMRSTRWQIIDLRAVSGPLTRFSVQSGGQHCFFFVDFGYFDNHGLREKVPTKFK